MILAAGLGTRLHPLTQSLPKPLVPVANQSLLDRLLQTLRAQGVQEVVINAHHLAETLIAAVGNGARWDLTITWSKEKKLLGTGGGLAAVQDFFAGEDAFIVVNGDVVLLDIDLQAAARSHLELGAAATAIVQPHDGDPQLGWLGMDGGARIRYVPGMSQTQSLKRVLFTGIHVLSQQIFAHLPRDTPHCVLRSGYRGLLEHAELINAYMAPGNVFLEVGRPEQLLFAQAALLRSDRCPPNVSVPENVQCQPPVNIGRNVRFGRAVRIGPYVSIGDNTTIGDDVMLENTAVLPGSIIDDGARLTGAIVWNGGVLTPRATGP